MDAVFRVEGTRALTSPHASGPWNPGHQHGAAPGSLIAWAAERVATATPMRLARITIDLLRPVPLAPLDIVSDVVREGRKIQLCLIRLLSEGVEVARGTVLKIRVEQLDLPETARGVPLDLPLPDEGREPKELLGGTNAFSTGVSMRVVKGGFREPGPGAVWFRANRPIIEGAPISPAMRAVIAADFCNGVSSVLDFRAWTFINGDLTVSLARMPVGEWILLDSETYAGEEGAAVGFARLGDVKGWFGRAAQSIVIERR
jgi:hypothetical protein